MSAPSLALSLERNGAVNSGQPAAANSYGSRAPRRNPPRSFGWRGCDRAVRLWLAQERRRVYYLAQAGELPVFQLGQTVCARRSTLLRFLEHRERVSLATAAEGAA